MRSQQRGWISLSSLKLLKINVALRLGRIGMAEADVQGHNLKMYPEQSHTSMHDLPWHFCSCSSIGEHGSFGFSESGPVLSNMEISQNSPYTIPNMDPCPSWPTPLLRLKHKPNMDPCNPYVPRTHPR